MVLKTDVSHKEMCYIRAHLLGYHVQRKSEDNLSSTEV